MALDGITVRCIVTELKKTLDGARIVKVAQPDRDSVVLSMKAYDTYRVFISSQALTPLVYIMEGNAENPKVAPNFCMLLRKHLNSAKLLDIIQPGLERVIAFKIEHLDDMGDLRIKYLIVEMMGKYSNIIFAEPSGDDGISDINRPEIQNGILKNLRIVDSIKHVSMLVSSVREVLPGKPYFIPETENKLDPLSVDYDTFRRYILAKNEPVQVSLYKIFTGFSPCFSTEICHRCNLDGRKSSSSLSEEEIEKLFSLIVFIMKDVQNGVFSPVLIKRDGKPVDFSAIPLKCYSDYSDNGNDVEIKSYSSISKLLFDFYSQKVIYGRMMQKSSDLRKLVSNTMEKDSKKLDLQQKQLKDTEKKDKYKVYGELLSAYGYSVGKGEKFVKVNNYYTGEDIEIPLNPEISAIENAKKYFDKYAKLKRTAEALTSLTSQTEDELKHLESISTSLQLSQSEQDLNEIKEEMIESGYMKRREKNKKNGGGSVRTKALKLGMPMHYVTDSGYDIYVGRNNLQNDELTFHLCDGADWWFHAKGVPGSHVVVKHKDGEMPDSVFEIAGTIAAFYSKKRDSGKADVDYLLRKNVKKPAGAKPGFVVYYTNYSLVADSNIEKLLAEGKIRYDKC
jgi:predicted ribosome quality control (RQC) complex YloA/Tae2 family protein